MYAEFKQCDFHSDVAFLQALNEPSARLRLPESSAEENQIAVSVESDRRSSHSAETLAFYSSADERGGAAEIATLSHPSEMDSLLHLNIAFKMIQILGQIIKNFPGSTKGSLKFTIARECYSLGLRAMNGMLNLIANNQDPLKKDLERWLHTRGVDPSEVGGRAEGLIRWLSEACALTFVLKTAEAVGLPKLGKTYDEILVKDTSVAVRMIDLAVRLEHMPAFPENELTALKKAVYNHPFARSVLTRLAYRHFYLYETGYRLRQRVCASLDIGVPNRRVQRALTRGIK